MYVRQYYKRRPRRVRGLASEKGGAYTPTPTPTPTSTVL